jgi:transposase InsO family protein
VSDKYAVIAAHRTAFDVRLMCRVLSVSRAGFYAAQRRRPSAHAQADARLRVVVRAEFAKAKARYGSPRVTRALKKRGVVIGEKRVARVMREEQLIARRKRRFVCTTQSAHAFPLAPNRVARDFAVGGPLNAVWASDVTYIPTLSGWLYLAIVLDLSSRRVLGWATSASNDTALALTALERALAVRQPTAGLVHHSDRGGGYASHAYRAALAARGIEASMSRAGNCWDNAVVESFFATVEWELLDGAPLQSHAGMTRALVQFIDGWYNRERMHSTLDYRSPVEYEQDLLRTTQAA